jgi:hypothetical protein
MKKLLATLTILAVGLPNIAQAALINREQGMIYDDVLNVTWLQDANYAITSGYTQEHGFTDNEMTWTEANTWATELTFGGYSDWRLPSVTPVNGSSFDSSFTFDGSSDNSYNIAGTNSEMASMYYANLNNAGFFDTSGNTTGCSVQGDAICLTETSFFTNLLPSDQSIYWTSTEDTTFTSNAWGFNMAIGQQFSFDKNRGLFNTWAVRTGDISLPSLSPISEVPIPSVVWLFGSALAGLLSIRKNRVK